MDGEDDAPKGQRRATGAEKGGTKPLPPGDGTPESQERPARIIDVRLVKTERKKIEFSLVTSLVSFVLSVTAALAAFYAFVRGPQVHVPTPQTLYLYRDGPENRGILKAAINFTMINTANGQYGDALMGARLRLGASPREWEQEAEARMTISSEAAAAAAPCPLGMRCVMDNGFLAQEDDFIPVSLGGGGVQTLNLVFPVVSTRCQGDRTACDATGHFASEVQTLVRKAMSVTLTLDFLRSGAKTVTCKVDGIDVGYLLGYGFASVSCEQDGEDDS
ncbi:MAG: hypothetical protein J2O44_03610 [Porphyrobacter sp.]|nr:hypothetical protein [Porphyrobacter sp.]